MKTFEEEFPSLKGMLEEIKEFSLTEDGQTPAVMLWPGHVRTHCIDKHHVKEVYKLLSLAIDNCNKRIEDLYYEGVVDEEMEIVFNKLKELDFDEKWIEEISKPHWLNEFATYDDYINEMMCGGSHID